MSSLFRGIGLSAIAGLSRRLGTGLHAGVGVLKLVDTEASYGSTKHKWRMSQVGKALRNGEPFAKALAAAQGYFPTLFIQMVHVGETSGRLERTLLMLAEHYEHRIKMRRLLLTGLAWPMIQLIGAIMVIGLVIWIQGVLAGPSGPSFDASGVGLSGTSGLVIYFGVVFSVAAIVIAAIVAVRENFMNVHRLIPYSYGCQCLGMRFKRSR